MFFKKEQTRIFLDHAAGTSIDHGIFEEMKPYFVDNFHNPSSLYREGVKTRNIIEHSRKEVADILKARSHEIYFVDGGTEANNIAILGAVQSWQKLHPHKIPHIITSVIEHSSVLETCKYLEGKGAEVTYISVDENGYVNSSELKKSLQENTVLISIGYVNGEIGTIQDVRSIMKIIRHARKQQRSVYPLFHTDAVQSINYVETIGVPQLGIDLMTLNASKIYGPKKSAVLFIKTGVPVEPIMFGGSQEQGLRSGTENIPYVVGMARSLSLARRIQESETQRLGILKKYFVDELKNSLPGIIINAEHANAIPNIVNITFPHISHEEIMVRLDARGILCSVKSACKAGEDGDSHVVRAVAKGNRPDRATGSIRFSMGRTTTKKDIQKTIKELKDIVERMNDTYKKYYIK